MAQYETLIVERIGRVERITLNRPEAANGLNLTMAQELARAAAACDADPEVRAVLLTGSGRFFSAGGDLKWMEANAADAGRAIKELADTLHRGLSSFARMDAPMVLAINGMAAGAGFSLALLGELVFAGQSAKFTSAYTRAGLSPDGSSTYVLPRLVGLRRAQELMLTNRVLSADEAADWGLITEVVPDEELAQLALDAASALAAGSKGAQSKVKQMLMSAHSNDLEAQMEIEARNIAGCAASSDGTEGREAFIAKRAPKFD
ncbi:enoyl-CoA hydratase-related protein [Sporichthya sp.]|uniref:enoyl-CoA hydratase/isomerase family protein n=1 Tax=Sporichthya sp. TaxID=65475 RepID=UPI0017B98578|nr:enoyl-CoA hydratase-related protein [Sporichthya sp.]MBA3744218.1 enoyl-CoA hydratase/isomerase family protein [Sporichthya sp.]